MNDKGLAAILAAGWDFPEDVWHGLSGYEKQFAVLEFSGARSPHYYEARLRALGFCDLQNVLDAACGMGQWSIVLSRVCSHVEGVDLSESRIRTARALAERHPGSVRFQAGSIETLPFAADRFDGVFCYGAFMFTNMPATLKEFARVMQPGGRLYLNANSWGWYAHLLLDRGLRAGNVGLVSAALRMVARAWCGRTSQRAVSAGWLRARLHAAGFRIVKCGVEGTVGFEESDHDLPPPAYPARYYGMTSILEVVAERET